METPHFTCPTWKIEEDSSTGQIKYAFVCFEEVTKRNIKVTKVLEDLDTGDVLQIYKLLKEKFNNY